jgi:hypothetical protein
MLHKKDDLLTTQEVARADGDVCAATVRQAEEASDEVFEQYERVRAEVETFCNEVGGRGGK